MSLKLLQVDKVINISFSLDLGHVKHKDSDI